MDYSSMSSTAGDQISRHNSDPFNEKRHAYDEPTSPTKAYIPVRKSHDIEKQSAHNSARSSASSTSHHEPWDIIPTSDDTEGLTKTLIYLSTINPLTTTLLSIFTILSTLLILIFGLPARLGKDSLSFQDQLIKALAPAIRWELRLTNIDINLFSRSPLSSTHLIGVLLLSPLLSIGITLAAWTAGSFWLYTTILGEPNQKQGKEVDGKSAARWVKRLWVRWLLLAL